MDHKITKKSFNKNDMNDKIQNDNDINDKIPNDINDINDQIPNDKNDNEMTDKINDCNDDIMSLSDDETISSTTDLDDVELLQKCSRHDLFTLIKEDPKYYIDLIKKNKLEHNLNILISRSIDGNGLNIKFKLYPDDRWIEVGYWGDSTDEEVYNEFKEQISVQLNKSQYGRKNEERYAHLESQLDKNNNIMSPDYGKNDNFKNLDKINQLQFKTPLEQTMSSILPQSQLNLRSSNTKQSNTKQSNTKQSSICNKNVTFAPLNKSHECISECRSGCNDKAVKRITPTIHKSRLAPENLKECLEDNIIEKPMDYLNNFIAQLLEKIIEAVPNLIVIDKNRNYTELINSLKDQDNLKDSVPDNYKMMHTNLLNQIRGCEYIQRIQYLTDWSLYPELKDYLIDFHREAMLQNPALYTKIKKDDLLKLLDDDDKHILEQYSLDIREIWLDYLNHQD